MSKEISVSYKKNQFEALVAITYTIGMEDDIQTITCAVRTEPGNTPPWLHVRKFELRSMLTDDGYTPLFTHSETTRGVHTLLFIDKAYHDIMAKESFRLSATEAV